jgi:hypothetical protein
MTIRDYVFNLVTTDSILNGYALNEQTVYNNNDWDTPKERPFMVLRWGATSLGMGVANVRALQVWIHDEPANYTNIDKALERVRELLANQTASFTGTANKWVIQVDWSGDSDDLFDDVQRTIARYSSFSVVGSAV